MYIMLAIRYRLNALLIMKKIKWRGENSHPCKQSTVNMGGAGIYERYFEFYF